MTRWLVIALCVITFAGCEKSPETKIEKAREKLIDAQAEAQKEQQEAVDKAADKVADETKDAQEAVQEANKDMAETQTEVAKDKAEAQNKLNTRLQEHQERAAKLAQQPPKNDPAEQNKHQQAMALVNTNLADAQTKVTAFAQASPTDWSGPYEAANKALDVLEQSLDNAD